MSESKESKESKEFIEDSVARADVFATEMLRVLRMELAAENIELTDREAIIVRKLLHGMAATTDALTALVVEADEKTCVTRKRRREFTDRMERAERLARHGLEE